MSCVVRKLAFFICKNKGTIQLHGYSSADPHRVFFRYIDSTCTIPLVSKSAISSLQPASVVEQSGFLLDLVGNPEIRFS